MSRTREEEERILQGICECIADSGRELARTVFWARLTTADGAVRMIQFQGQPPVRLEMPLDYGTPAYEPASDDWMRPDPRIRSRRYELVDDGRRVWEYREVAV